MAKICAMPFTLLISSQAYNIRFIFNWIESLSSINSTSRKKKSFRLKKTQRVRETREERIFKNWSMMTGISQDLSFKEKRLN